MMEKGPKQQSVEIQPTTFKNDDSVNAEHDDKRKIIDALRPK